MAKASWGGKIIAESSATVVVEGNQYFPPESVNKKFLTPSNHTRVCPWKGTAHYFHVAVDGMQNDTAAWYYPQPKPAAAEIKDRIAFWNGVRVKRCPLRIPPLYLAISFLKTAPSCIANRTCSSSPASFSGSPDTAITSAYAPGAITPISPFMSSISAARDVAD